MKKSVAAATALALGAAGSAGAAAGALSGAKKKHRAPRRSLSGAKIKPHSIGLDRLSAAAIKSLKAGAGPAGAAGGAGAAGPPGLPGFAAAGGVRGADGAGGAVVLSASEGALTSAAAFASLVNTNYQTAEAAVQIPLPASLKSASGLIASVSSAPGAPIVLTLRDNGANTPVTCTIAAGATGCSSPAAAVQPLVGGDLLDLGITGGTKGGPGLSFALRVGSS